MHRDFIEIYKFAYELGLKITLFTNGFYYPENIERVLQQYKPHKVECTLYGISNETYLATTHVKNAYDTVVYNLQKLRHTGINLSVKTLFTSINFHERNALWKELSYWCEETPKFDYHILPRREDDWTNTIQYQLTTNDIIKLLSELDIPFVQDNRVNRREKTDRLFLCGAGSYSFCILVNENMQLCSFAYFSSQSLKMKSLKEVWQSYAHYSEMKMAKENCVNNCMMKSICGKCPVSCYLYNAHIDNESERLQNREEWNCNLAHERYRICGQGK